MAKLDELLARMTARDPDLGDWTDLPTYGGAAPPTGTLGVWSWDHARLIVGSTPRIDTREEWAEALELATGGRADGRTGGRANNTNNTKEGDLR